jgi:hypothetical protein
MWFHNYADAVDGDHDNDDGDDNDVHPLISIDQLPVVYRFRVAVGMQVILDNSDNTKVMLKLW